MASPEAETTVACTECGAADAIQIELSLPDGTVVLFCSCHRCEKRWWNTDGEDIRLEAVLKLARKSAKK
jgi:DNA-directed RNA polymerase subunit M/transcription elongation factor TFIIS